jgi:DNA-binding NarL/FixJ family response regulator
MMIQKNRMLNDILSSLKSIKHVSDDSKHVLTKLNQQIKHSIQSGEDWEMFRHYFEEINPDFYPRLLKINSKITPAEQKLSALIKLNFNIKETASLLNISPDSVKTTRHILRKKLGLEKNENIHEFLNSL